MQKKLIALAVASLVSAPAFAQSQVQIYGVIDQAFSSGNYGKGNVAQIQGSGYTTERLGFKGSEDMGNGLKANFMLEMGIRSDAGMLDNSANQLFQRVSTVGLSGNWGEVNFGRQYTPVFSIQGANDIFRVAGYGTAYALTNTGVTRANNSIRFDSANMNGFSAAVMYSMGDTGATGATAQAALNDTTAASPLNGSTGSVYQESTVDPKDLGRHVGVNVRYANGPLALGLGYGAQKAMAVNTVNTGVTTQKTTAFAGSYDFKVVAINVGYQTNKNDAPAGNAAPSFAASELRVWTAGATVPVFGKDSVKLSYNGLHNKLTSSADSKLWSLGYVHPMSKRTVLYGTYAKMTNDSAATKSFFGAPSLGAAGYDPSTIQLGLQHAF